MKKILINHLFLILYLTSIMFFGVLSCKKTDSATTASQPKADFTFASPGAGLLPTTVNFSNTSTNASNYQWTFDDGNSSTAQNPSNTYTATNTYNVKLVVTGAGGKDSIIKPVTITQSKPVPSFSFTILDNGNYPVHVNFTNTSSGAASYKWLFDNGDTSNLQSPADSFFTMHSFNVKLIAINAAGKDSITVPVGININPPTTAFTYSIINIGNLPLNITTKNTSVKAASYLWDFGDATTATTKEPTHTYTNGGIYTLKLICTNPGGSSSSTSLVYVSPYPFTYTSFDGTSYNLNVWEGKKVAVLSRNLNLNKTAMFNWAKTMDTVYGYYKLCTGIEPGIAKIVNNHTTVADVTTTCGAGCGYLGATGIELQNTYFDNMYNGINNNNQYDQANFYEFGRNFWFYGNQLAYKTNDPITTGYAVLMRFMSLDASGVAGGPFNGTMPYAQFKTAVTNLVDQYLANTSLNWANTLGANAGVPGQFGGATDLFASFVMRLKRDYGGETFIQNVWKKAGLRPNAITTQDAVDNFFLASCAAANKNLTTVFQTWRWPLSATAITAATQYP